MEREDMVESMEGFRARSARRTESAMLGGEVKGGFAATLGVGEVTLRVSGIVGDLGEDVEPDDCEDLAVVLELLLEPFDVRKAVNRSLGVDRASASEFRVE